MVGCGENLMKEQFMKINESITILKTSMIKNSNNTSLMQDISVKVI
jgi:hypothetical protein